MIYDSDFAITWLQDADDFRPLDMIQMEERTLKWLLKVEWIENKWQEKKKGFNMLKIFDPKKWFLNLYHFVIYITVSYSQKVKPYS